MSTALNQAFIRNPNGVTNFPHRRPMLVEAQSVTIGMIHNPNTGTMAAQRVAISERLASGVQPSANTNVRVLDAQVFYCDFEFFDVLQNARGTQYSRPKLVCPGLSITPDANKVPMYYLPWREDKRFTMELGNSANYFMTAGMHGCKFEVNYNPATHQTIVSHTNVQPLAAPNPVFVQPHVAQGLTQLTTDDVFAQACPTVLTFGKINYFWDAIRESGRIQTTMLANGVQTDEIEEASPSSYQANVVGIRNGHNWTFYYQLTLMVKCQLKAQVKKKKWLGLKSYWSEVRNQMIFDVVVAVKRIWPAPTADIAILPD